MLPGTLNIEVIAGDGYRNVITFKDALGEIINVSGYTFSSQIRKNAKSEIATDFDIDDSDGENGTIAISLSGDKVRALGLGRNLWDLEYVVGNSDPTTILGGTFKVLPDITRLTV